MMILNFDLAPIKILELVLNFSLDRLWVPCL